VVPPREAWAATKASLRPWYKRRHTDPIVERMDRSACEAEAERDAQIKSGRRAALD
jgi:hypothetical protein